MLKIAIFLLVSLSAFAQMQAIDIMPPWQKGRTFMNIKILDAQQLLFEPYKGIAFTEISGLAYDKAHDILYALSDKGYLYRLKLKIKKKRLASIKMLEAFRLTSKKGKALKKSKRDSEGLAWVDEGVIISFERKPNVSLYTFEGRKIKNYSLQKSLQNPKNYQGKNKMLEAVCIHPDLGMIMAPERALRDRDKHIHTLFGERKRQWHFKAIGDIKAIEPMQDGTLLVMERPFKQHKAKRAAISLSQVTLKGCKKAEECSVKRVAFLDSIDGWKLENFEGLTRLEGNRFLMISDNGGASNSPSIVVLFEVNVNGL